MYTQLKTIVVLLIILLSSGCAHRKQDALIEQAKKIHKLELSLDRERAMSDLFRYMLTEMDATLHPPPLCDEEQMQVILMNTQGASIKLLALESNCNWRALQLGRMPTKWDEWPIMAPWSDYEQFDPTTLCTPVATRYLYEQCLASTPDSHVANCEELTAQVCMRY